MHQSREADPSGTKQNRNKPGIRRAERGLSSPGRQTALSSWGGSPLFTRRWVWMSPAMVYFRSLAGLHSVRGSAHPVPR